MKNRADMVLVARGLFESRARAQAAIAAGLVSADGITVRKASEAIAANAVIEASAPHPYVSRGGLKLAAALDHFGLSPEGLDCLDCGASTGGFSDVLLRRGAASVLAVDTGRAQFHADLVEIDGIAEAIGPGVGFGRGRDVEGEDQARVGGDGGMGGGHRAHSVRRPSRLQRVASSGLAQSRISAASQEP